MAEENLRYSMFKQRKIIRDYDQPLEKQFSRKSFAGKRDGNGEKIRQVWSEYIDKYNLCQIPGDFHVTPIHNLVEFNYPLLDLKNENLYLPQTKNEFPCDELINSDESRDLSFLIVFSQKPQNIEEFPSIYERIRFFYTRRIGSLNHMIVDPAEEESGQGLRGTRRAKFYTPITSIEDALSRPILSPDKLILVQNKAMTKHRMQILAEKRNKNTKK